MADTGVAPIEPNASTLVQLLGPPQLLTADGRRLALERRDAAVLAYLAIEGDTPRARLLELLWPDSEPEAARNTLRQRLFQLKKRAGVELAAGGEVLALANAVASDVGAASSSIAPLLESQDYSDCPHFSAWLTAQRERLTNARRDALIAQAEGAERDGRLAHAIGVAEQLIALDPVHEHGHRRLMRLHYLRGDRAAALAAFDRCERVLKHDVSAKPGDETLELLKTIEASGALTVAPKRAPIPASILRPPRLIGRERELGAMRMAWTSGRAFLLLGEAGVGKTRLLAELAAETPGAVHVQARPGDSGIPYASLARLLRALIERVPAVIEAAPRYELARVLPELGEVAAGVREGQRLTLRAIDAVVRAAAGYDVAALLVDDLHYADDASLEMLGALGLVDPAGDVRWGYAQRPSEGGAAAQKMHDTLSDARRLETVTLPALEESQMVELIESLGLPELKGSKVAPMLMRHTGGNPLFALETLKQLSLTGPTKASELPRPASVGQLIERRLRQLSQPATALARVAAVAGMDFSVRVAEAVTGASALELADAWQELEAANVLRGDAFAHDLVYEAALATVPQSITRHLHRSIAQWLQANGGQSARIAWHFTSSGSPALAAEHWMLSAHAAQAALRFVEATDAFERAAHGFSAGGRAQLAFDAAYAMRQASFEVDLSERSSTALELLERFASTPAQRARAHNERAVTRLHQGDLPGTEQSALAGLRELGGANEPMLRAELRRNLAATYAWRNETHAALNELRSIQHDVERLGSPLQKFEFWESLAIVLDHVDQSDESERTHRRAIEAAVEIGNLPGAAQSALNLAVCLHDAGRLQEALAPLERARGMLAAVQSERLSYSSLNLNYGFVLRGLGEYTGALEHLQAAIENCRAQTPGWLPLVMANRALLFLHLGQFARARQDLEAALPDDASPLWARCKWATVHAAVSHALGQRPANDLDTLIALQPTSGRGVTRWRLLRARLEHETDAEATERGLALLGEITRAGRTGLAISVGAQLAPRLASLGRAEEARTLARQTLELMRSHHPDDAYRGDVWLQCCRVLREDFDTELPHAVQWIEETARLRVPAEFRDSFLNRNSSNRELIRAASRRRPALR